MAASDYEIHDRRFRAAINGTAHVEKLWSGCRWAEGPAYFAAGRYLVWSDIPNDRMLRYDECDGHVSVFRQPSGHSNGNTVDRQGRLVSCEHGGRRISRTEHDGRVVTLASHFRDRRLNSPNDVVVKSDGSVWFTDPPYGILSDYEGDKADSEIGGNHVYRLDPDSAAVAIVADDFDKPNGLAFSRDETRLYVADTGASHADDGPRHLRVFDVAADGTLGGGAVFAECTAGLFDGFRLDSDGRLWVSAADGVHCLSPEGELLGKVLVPEVVANVAFGGPKRNRLYICATTSLYSVMLTVNGA
ncbi:MAG: SMP-30/gluconolactonase/LRE family protein [Lautropia sp.]